MFSFMKKWGFFCKGSRPKKNLTFLADVSVKGGGAKPLSTMRIYVFVEGRIMPEILSKTKIFEYMKKKT